MHIVSRDAFRGIFAFYAAKAHHDHKLDGEDRLMALIATSRDISDELLNEWSDRVDALGPAAVGDELRARAYDVIRGSVVYDHASQFLHTVISELGQKQA